MVIHPFLSFHLLIYPFVSSSPAASLSLVFSSISLFPSQALHS